MARERRRRRAANESDVQEIPKAPAYIKRKIPHYSILSDDDLSVIEENADTILEEIGIVFSEDQEALDILEKAGALGVFCASDSSTDLPPTSSSFSSHLNSPC